MPVTIRGQFRRSVHLVRDFYSARDLGGYVVTAKALEATGRIAEALGTPGAPRAWSVAGPYGGGKSAFALFMSRLLRGDASAAELLAAAAPALADQLREAASGPFAPVLVVGSRGAITRALADGLAQSLEAFVAGLPRGRGRKAAVAHAAALAGEARLATTEPEVVDVYDRAAAFVHAQTGGGLLVVVDELGKHLEYAALHPGDGDPFVLQSLAERSGRPDAAPLVLLTVLHQAFERYAVGLGSEQREAWAKVQGRFEEVAFVEPVGETLRLLAAAVEADLPAAVVAEGERAVAALLEAAALPSRLDVAAAAERLRQALPVHPAVALLVGPLFRRLAQNERSLFAFLASGEPRSVLDVVGAGDGLYRLDHLYDYLTATLGGALHHEGAGRLWAEAEAALSRVGGDALHERVLKQVAVLSFAGALAGLPPTEEVLRAASGAPAEATRTALAALREARAVTFRPHHREYRLWEGSDFDVAAALAEARNGIPLRTSLARLLAQAAPPEPTVARRHAFETGTHRAFEVAYADAADWQTALDAPLGEADGRVLYVLPDAAGPDLVAEIAAHTAAGDGRRLACVLDGTAGLADLARDVAALDWVRETNAALEGDKVARREVDAQRTDLRAALEHRLAAALAPSAGTWVRAGQTLDLADDGFQPMLSEVCDAVFHRTPRVRSELLNRRRPSSSAVRALKLLLQAMTERPHAPALGIEGTPAEFALYVTVLQETGLHQERDGAWAFAGPGDDGVEAGAAAVLGALAEAIGAARSAPVAVPDLYDLVRAAPYGVRDGLLPVFLTVVLARLGDDVALFEDGVYQWSLSYEAVERLLRVPGSFAVQSVGASAAQAAAIAAVAPRVGLAEGAAKPLPVVGRVLQAVSGLPAYVRRTESLSAEAMAVREALVHATEPAALLFRELPAALGLAAFGDGAATDAVERRAAAFADALAEVLRELAAAYDGLLAGLDAELAAAFDLRAPTPDGRRDELAARARALRDDRADASVRAFVVRAADDLADTRAWTESLAALLARTPPAQWADPDHGRFSAALASVADAFRGREAVQLSAADAPADAARAATRFRLRVTSTHEEERDSLVTVHPEDAAAVDDTARQLAAVLDGSGRALDTQLAALSRLSLALLERRAQGEGSLADLLAAPPDPPDAADAR